MNYELYRLLQKKKRSKSAKRKFMSQSLVIPNNSSTHSMATQKQKAATRKQKTSFERKVSQPEASESPRFRRMAHDLTLEFSVPRNPNKQKEFSFDKENSKEMVIADNFSFSEKLHSDLKRVKKEEKESSSKQPSSQTFASGVFGSICSSIMSRYNSFIQVDLLFFKTLEWQMICCFDF